jgi:hypothetical protein
MGRLFALDQNFPEPLVESLSEFIVACELVPVRKIDPSLSKLEDWELLLALHNHEREWDGLITNDANMLRLPHELSTLMQTRLTLVVARSQGDNPVRATGIVLAHIEHICHHTSRGEAQVWDLSIKQKEAQEPWEMLRKVAEKEGRTANDLYLQYKLGSDALRSK